ncbi:unnamed protein product, partial [Mesorhabditis belari]|uniref:Calcineurin-like phosphoesterase domain-containing protein n=1 Tax=Mesorhabditis belari TaxID=2138241 RepID=A0AAF3EGN3_9BILA
MISVFPLFFTILIVLPWLQAKILPEDESYPKKDELTLLLMGDPQYHFKCETTNVECKTASRYCRMLNRLDINLRPVYPYNETWRKGRDDCTKIESRFANRVQRIAMEKLIKEFPYEPAALIIDGDLTDFGHMYQFNEFMSGWMTSFPIPILPGLGNHDCDNNVDDCVFNFCAHTMMNWFCEYASNQSLQLDYVRTAQNTFDIKYEGSFAYSTRVCAVTGKNCANIIQLNNALDYERSFTSVMIEWKLLSTIEWLKKRLNLLADSNLPILINVHQNEGVRGEKMKELLSDWIYSQRNLPKPPRVAVFFAHMHQLHQVKIQCLHGIPVPFVYVGSVPNNRFSMLRVGANSTSLYGFSTKSSGSIFLSKVSDFWPSDCSQTSWHTFYDGPDEF